MIGKKLAHYRIVEKIGAGGMGEVYRATDSKLGRDVALKVLPPVFARDADRMARFEREARLLAALNHTGIASIYGIEQDDGVRFLAMELAEGEDLATRLARGPIDVPVALEVARQIAEALEEAHAQGIVHRDLKPANIKVSPQGKVKILDFGLAKALVDDSQDSGILENSPTVTPSVTRAGFILGTAAYMSPEQARGQVVDSRTDVWAFGCVLFEMLAGKSPFGGNTPSDVIAAVLEREPDWSVLPASMPASILTLLSRCLRKDANVRLHSVADARIELADTASGLSTIGVPPAAPSRPGGGSPRWLLPAVAVGAFLLGAFLVGRPPGPSSEGAWEGDRLARLMIEVPEESPAVPHPTSSSVAISRDGRFVVYLGSAASTGLGTLDGSVETSMLFFRSLDGTEVTPIEGTFGATSPFFSPDGEWIGFLDNRARRLKKIARAGGAPVDLCASPPTLRGACWSGDGRIYFAGGQGGIWEVPEDGGTPVARSTPEEYVKTHRFPDVLPGDRALLMTHGQADIPTYDDADVALLDLDTGEIEILYRGGTNPRYVPTGHIVFARAGDLLAIPFDPESREIGGAPFPVLEGVITSDGYGSAQYSFSRDGKLVFIGGGPDQYYFDMFTLHDDGRVEPVPVSPQTFGDARVSPDGTQIAVSVLGANASIWMYDVARGTMNRLTHDWDKSSMIWHPDGRTLTFNSNRGGFESIWSLAADGDGREELLFRAESQAFPNSWTPDGTRLALSLQFAGSGADIFLWSAETDPPIQPLIATTNREFVGQFSPDGKHIAYVSDESGRPEVYVQPYPLTGQKWRLSERGGDGPLWSPDGSRVFFWNQQELMAVDVRSGGRFAPSRARVLVESPIIDVQTYDVYPDGKRFLVVGRTSHSERRQPIVTPDGHRRVYPAMTPDLQVIVNWFSEFY